MAGRGRTVQPEGTSSATRKENLMSVPPRTEPGRSRWEVEGEPPRAKKSDRLGLALVIAVLTAIVVALFVLLVL